MTRDWSADDILELGGGYKEACVLAAAADLELFVAIGADEIDAQEVAQRIRGDSRGTTILLDALTALELLHKTDNRYAVPPSVQLLLRAGGSESVLAMVQHQANCMRRWSRLAQTVREGEPPERTPSVRGEERDKVAFIEAMDVINRHAAAELVDEIAPGPFTHLLDIGGGPGTWTIAWLRWNPDARATLFDLPHVIPLAERRLREAGLLDRVTFVAGDFDTDPLPAGADLAWLSAIVHQNSRAENRTLLAKIHAALVPNGRILIRDIVMDTTRTKPRGGALFAVNMLAATTGGGTFTFPELAEDLEAAGFTDAKQLREDEWMHAVVAARRA
ncbi:MAG: methyltransferase [Planctomycetota bacterium]|jgi:precorrin-6B methylase 2